MAEENPARFEIHAFIPRLSFPNYRYGRANFATATRLHIVLESGHANAEDAVRIYNWAQGRISQSQALAGLTFSEKKGCLPLAAADLFAYTSWNKMTGQKPLGIAKKPIKSGSSYRGNMYRVEITRDSLDSLHEQALMFAAGGSGLSRASGGRSF